jgi:hypothetical protein
MDMPTPSERVNKYDETRGMFASMDSGLDNWISNMKTDHPEHASATSSFSGSGSVPPPAAVGAPTGAAQQPYYQQYLDASSPTATQSTTRSRLAGLPMQAQAAAGSAFGHSGGQIGTKSKELMQSAGKLGKGLFSKGKSKLRGDKVFH